MPQVQVTSLHDEEKPECGGSMRWMHSDLGLSDKNTKKFETLVLPTILKWVGQHLNTWAIEDNDELYNQYAYAHDSIIISVFGEEIFKTMLMMRTRVLDTLVSLVHLQHIILILSFRFSTVSICGVTGSVRLRKTR